MIKAIYLYGSEVLRTEACDADLSEKESLGELITNLWDTLAASEGCGLAAPQIGVSLRVAVVDGDVMKDVYPYLAGFKRTFINPVVLSESETCCEYNEGCLSVPGIYADVRRPEEIEVEYYDENLELKREKFSKFACRMIQHEFAHLDGHVFTDSVAPVRRKILAAKLQKIAKGKVGTAYKSVIK